MLKTLITLKGLDKVKGELTRLKTQERPAVIAAISSARDLGDLSENAEYHAARERQGFVEARIAELESLMMTIEVVDVTKLSGDTVRFGATVTLVDEDTNEQRTYMIVGEEESDISEGRVSNTSPLARAIIGKKVGASVEVATPAGRRAYEIMAIEFLG